MDFFLLNIDNNKLIQAIYNLKNNKRVIQKVIRELIKYKSTRRIPTNNTELKLQQVSIQKIKDDLYVNLTIQLLNYRMLQFITWFKYIMSRRLCLTNRVSQRWRRDYPYKKTGVGRKYIIIY